MLTNQENNFITLFSKTEITNLRVDYLTPIDIKRSKKLDEIDFVPKKVADLDNQFNYTIRMSKSGKYLATHNSKDEIQIFKISEKKFELYKNGFLRISDMKKTNFEVNLIFGVEDPNDKEGLNHGIVDLHFWSDELILVFTIDKICHLFDLRGKKELKYQCSVLIPQLNPYNYSHLTKKMKTKDIDEYENFTRKLTITGCASSEIVKRKQESKLISEFLISALRPDEENLSSYVLLYDIEVKKERKKRHSKGEKSPKTLRFKFRGMKKIENYDNKNEISDNPLIVKTIWYNQNWYCLMWENSALVKLNISKSKKEDVIELGRWISVKGMDSSIGMTLAEKVNKTEDEDSFVLKGKIKEEENPKILYIFDCKGNIVKIDAENLGAFEDSQLEEIIKLANDKINSGRKEDWNGESEEEGDC